MTTPDQLAEQARRDSEKAHLEAEAIEKDLPAAKLQREQAKTAADEAEKRVGPLEVKSQTSEGDARAAEAGCKEAQTNEGLAQKKLQKSRAELADLKAMHPNESNPEVETKELDVATDEIDLAEASAARKKACEKAETERKKADQDKKDFVAAQTEADTLRTRSDEANKGYKQMESDAQDLRQKAVNLAGVADQQKTIAAAPVNNVPTMSAGPVKPVHPDTTTTGALTGAAPQPGSEQGFHFSTALDATTGGNFNLFMVGGEDYAQVGGKLIELTEGFSSTHTLGYDRSYTLGAKLDETFGLELKLDFNDDTRYISGHRWEANVGLRLEHVLGEYHETVHGDRRENNPTFYFGQNKVRQQERDERMLHTASSVIAKHKALFEEFRKQVKLDYQAQTDKLGTVESTITHYQAELKKYDEKITELEAKWDDLKEQVDNFKSNSDGFMKFLVQGSADISSDKLKVKVDDKLQVICDSIAELQGSEIKWA